MSFSSEHSISHRTRSFSSKSNIQPIHIWAWIGIFLVAVEIIFTIKWVSSEHFVSVPSGPDLPPTWMQWVLDIGQIVFTMSWCFLIYWFVMKPWFRDRRLSLDGLLVIGCTLASMWDALSNTGQYWFTYNSYLVNRGSIQAVLPITVAPHAPGSSEAWPVFFINTFYGHFVFVAILMCAFLRQVKSKFPEISTFSLILTTFLVGAAVDTVLEGFIVLPLGFWSYAGGKWALNADTYYKFPLHEAICAGGVFAGLTCIRFFVNDKGETLCERGLDKLNYSKAKKGFVRCMAILGCVISVFIVAYHIPQGFIALHSSQWPEENIQKSYFNNSVCGPVVNRACPGPTVPIARQDAPYLDMTGNFVSPINSPATNKREVKNLFGKKLENK